MRIRPGRLDDVARELAECWFVALLRDDRVRLVGSGLWCKGPTDADQLVRRIDETTADWWWTLRESETDGDRRAISELIGTFGDFAAKLRASIERCLVGMRWENTRIGLLGLLIYVGVDADRLQRDVQVSAARSRSALKEVP